MLQIWYYPSVKKSKDNLLPNLIHIKVTFWASLKKMIFMLKNMAFCWNTILIGILDWHFSKSSNDSLYIYVDHYKRFYILLSSEKKLQET